MTAQVHVPHAGSGTHTLVVAIEVDDAWLADTSRHRDIVDSLVRLAVAELAAAPPALRHLADVRDDAVARCDHCGEPALSDGRWCLACFHLYVDGKLAKPRTPRRRIHLVARPT